MKKLSFLFAVASLVLLSCKEQKHIKTEENKLTASYPVKKDTTIFQEYVCQIRAIQHIELRSLEKGYLQKIYIDEGQFVKKGQLLFQILPLVYRAETEIFAAELSLAEIEFQNTKSLADSLIVSKNELAMAKAKLNKARADLNRAKVHLQFTEIRAPFDGIIGRFNEVRLGSLLDEGELLTTLSDNSKMWVYFNVPEAAYLDFKSHNTLNSKVKVKLEMANNELYSEPGFIEIVEADFNNETGNIAFRAAFENKNGLLRHGETGKILMPFFVHDVLLIPQVSTFEILDKKFVFVIGAENKIEAREVQVAIDLPHVYAIKSGLKATDKILVEGLRKVKNGDEVIPVLKPFETILSELTQLQAE